MKAMILAAGLGSRMRPLTDNCPKPLLRAAGKPLIDYHLERLEQLGIIDVAINTHWLANQVDQHINARWAQGLNIQLFCEHELLETAGGIVNALPALSPRPNDHQDEAFLLINGDVFFDADLKPWLDQAAKSDFPSAHLLLVDNPEHNLSGDFSFGVSTNDKVSNLARSGLITQHAQTNSHTYSGIGLYRPSMFENLEPGKRALGPLLKTLASEDRLYATELKGYWLDVGTPGRLDDLNQHLTN